MRLSSLHLTSKLDRGTPFISRRRAQLLEGARLLLVISDRTGNLNIYLESLAGMDAAVSRGRGKPLNRDKIGQEFLLAYDESKKMLAVVSSDRVRVVLPYHGCARSIVHLSPGHSCYSTFSCLMTHAGSRLWGAQSTCTRGTAKRWLFVMHVL